MRLELTGRHVTISAALRAVVEHRVSRLRRTLQDGAVSVQVVLIREKAGHRAEVTLHVRGDHFLHAEGADRSARMAIDAAFEKIEHQAQKLKGKRTSRHKAGAARATRARAADSGRREPPDDRDRHVRIVRARRYALKPMSVDDAALQVGDLPPAFLVFRNATTDALNVLFRRPDGHLGLIEPED